ncbi:hypothetical protein ABH920_009192 [Catenulispora sp. EB89]|uniref:hypothetical protein n=1 Tax=Catenulispora sp. EB89 TaxID=3156257 RepID=UPI003512069F
MLGAAPRSEVDVFHLSDVRDLLQKHRLVFRRGRKLAPTKNGKAALADPAKLFDLAVVSWFGGVRFDRELAEAAAVRLLADPDEADDIAGAVLPLVVAGTASTEVSRSPQATPATTPTTSSTPAGRSASSPTVETTTGGCATSAGSPSPAAPPP